MRAVTFVPKWRCLCIKPVSLNWGRIIAQPERVRSKTRAGNNQPGLNCFSSYVPSGWNCPEQSKVKKSVLPFLSTLQQEQTCLTRASVSRKVELFFLCCCSYRPGSCVILAGTRSPLWEVPEAAGKPCLWMDCCHWFNTESSQSCTVYSIILQILKKCKPNLIREKKKRPNGKTPLIDDLIAVIVTVKKKKNPFHLSHHTNVD